MFGSFLVVLSYLAFSGSARVHLFVKAAPMMVSRFELGLWDFSSRLL